MKKTFEEKIKSGLIKIGRKNGFLRIAIIPFIFVLMTIKSVFKYFKGNVKRFSMIGLTAIFFTVYCSFSFPIFLTNVSETDLIAEFESEYEDIDLVDSEEIPVASPDVITREFASKDDEEDGDVFSADDIIGEYTPEITDYSDIEINTDFDAGDWKLILINKQNSIPEDYEFELATLAGTMQCDKRVIPYVKDMVAAAKNDGVNLVIRSPYRNLDRQTFLFNKKVTNYMNKGMSYVDAYRLASEAVTVPGSSEHQAGLAFDITCDYYTSLDEDFGDTEAGIWLAQNSYKYGFILRYPLGKELITGIEYEPWHFRYVGVDAATVMTLEEICLEEFWEEYL
ncbi:MAG: M15 family metallopeptidase [Acetatifactor sp.]|nr:M15 family metallopeptidase [Acetatifactor sp.]